MCASVTEMLVTDSARKTSEADVQYMNQFLLVNTVHSDLSCTRNHQDYQLHHWRPAVLFTNQPRFRVSTCDRHVRVWIRLAERNAEYNIEYGRYGGGFIMVWHGISLDGRAGLRVL